MSEAERLAPSDVFAPGLIQGVLLVMACWCTVLAAGLLSPVLPQMAAEFAATPHIDLLIGFVATMPALSVAVMAVPFGWLADRIGQRRVLLGGFLIYGLAGIVPFWLENLQSIILARLAVGIGEAAVMTSSTALLGLYFQGEHRGRWLAAQVAASNMLAVLVMFFGGLLGLLGWHIPFLAYSFALILLIPSSYFLRQPAKFRSGAGIGGAQPSLDRKAAGAFRTASLVCGLNFCSTVALFVVVVQMAFLLSHRGARNSADIGLGIALGALGVASGAVTSGKLARWSWQLRVAAGFFLSGGAYMLIAVLAGYWATALTGSVAGFGGGLIIPALLSALIVHTPQRVMGRVIGVWTATAFIGQFANPPLFVLLRSWGGSQSAAFVIFGTACVILAVGVMMFMRADHKMAARGSSI